MIRVVITIMIRVGQFVGCMLQNLEDIVQQDWAMTFMLVAELLHEFHRCGLYPITHRFRDLEGTACSRYGGGKLYWIHSHSAK